ncbi:Uncharacterised protein [Mycobacterium tuberculosis]|uniref:Uncharacterized protein n=1 Tax=Mycobacterium tuberculosis TaxID=1773 RepID=A0A916LDS0_MYCTX|nr:Uncharacterised protein [Mycobacterium tuberculosis]COX16651.1 Uncharacterised protein [Mycobacterium tuberculosis]COX43753.1 Uncharacterised protein [Mycobacterium tuberculosis]COY50028.1 Uncharacterised protein [Mycobacterium tuberculosis]
MANRFGKTRAMVRRFSITYDTPDGERRLSSRTRKSPRWSRIRSMPATWIRTPLGGTIPTA